MGTSKPQNTTHTQDHPPPSEWSFSLFISTTIKTINTCFIMTNLIAIANRKLNFSNWIKWIQGQIQYGQSNMISHDYADMSNMDFLKNSFHQVESPFGPGPRDTAPPLSLHVHVPPACRHLWFSPVEKVTKQSSPESWPAYLVSSRLISQLDQGSWSREGLTL